MDEIQEEKRTTNGSKDARLTAPPLEQGAIRGAFLARASHAAQSPSAGGEAESSSATVKDAYLRHLAPPKRPGAVVGDETSGDAVLRSIYAARSTPVAMPAVPARKAPAKKKRAAAKTPKRAPAAKRAVKRAAKKRAAPSRAAKARRPAAQKRRKTGRKSRR